MTNISETDFTKWLASQYAEQYLLCETSYLENALRQVSGPRVLQLGTLINTAVIKEIDFPQHVVADIDGDAKNDCCLRVDPAFLPFHEELISTVILPHVLERHHLHHQVLREVHRVLMPEGHIIVTGFNPFSMMGLQRLIFKRAVCPGSYFSIKRASDWLQLLGFEIIASATFQYGPLIKNTRLRKIVGFLNSIGDRWLPMFGGGYIITARKKQSSGSFVGHIDLAKSPIKKPRRKLATASSQSKKANY